MQSRMQFSQFWFSYKFALRHISMRRSHLFSKRSNSKSSNLHMLAKVFRVNFRFWFTSWFLDSRRSLQLSSVLEHCQEHSVICWIDSWIISNVSRVENEWKSLFWGRLIWRNFKSSLFSNLSLVILLFWGSHYFEKVLECVVLFYFYFFRSLYHSFEKASDCYLWESLACCCFICLLALSSINRLSRSTLRESLIWES